MKTKQLLFARNGQVWMETLLYTVVTLAILGTVLSFALPRLHMGQERARIAEQLTTLRALDNLISDLNTQPPGSSRSIAISVKQGTLSFDAGADSISWTMPNLKLEYSEQGVEVRDGHIAVLTTKEGVTHTVKLTVNYAALGINATLDGKETYGELSSAPTPYRLSFTTLQDVTSQGKVVRKISIQGIPGAITLPPVCGNGRVEGNEPCDLGVGNGACPNKCSSLCTPN